MYEPELFYTCEETISNFIIKWKKYKWINQVFVNPLFPLFPRKNPLIFEPFLRFFWKIRLPYFLTSKLCNLNSVTPFFRFCIVKGEMDEGINQHGRANEQSQIHRTVPLLGMSKKLNIELLSLNHKKINQATKNNAFLIELLI